MDYPILDLTYRDRLGLLTRACQFGFGIYNKTSHSQYLISSCLVVKKYPFFKCIVIFAKIQKNTLNYQELYRDLF